VPTSVVSSGIWQSLPLFVYAFNCAVPFIPIFVEMKRKKGLRVRITVSFAVLLCFLTYCACAFGGYWSFCGKACPNILDCFPASDALILPGRVALLFILTGCIPLFNFIVRHCIEKQMGWISEGSRESQRPLCSVVLTIVLVAAATIMAVVFKNLGVVLGLTGAIGGSILVWILPGFFLLKLGKLGVTRARLYGDKTPLSMFRSPPPAEVTPSTSPKMFESDSSKQSSPRPLESPLGAVAGLAGSAAAPAGTRTNDLKFQGVVLVVVGLLLLCLGTVVTIMQP